MKITEEEPSLSKPNTPHSNNIDEEEELQELQEHDEVEEYKLQEQRFKVDSFARRLSSELVPIRVHNVFINGNTKTKDWIIKAELNGIQNATTMQELMQASQIALVRLKRLGIFDSCRVRLEAGPVDLANSAIVIVDVVETDNNLSGGFGVYMKPSTNAWTSEGTVKYKNIFGYGDLWNASLARGGNKSTEMSLEVFAPRLKGLLIPIVARMFMLSQDWQDFSSYKEQLVGMSLGLISTKHEDLVYTLGWRTLTDPSQMASRSIRRQLGHGLLSSLKYTFKFDRRDSPMRPTKGYAFVSTTNLGGLTPDHRSLGFLRQELDVRFAVPFGFYNTALNFGISAGAVFPWGQGFRTKPSPLPERFYLGSDFSPVCTLGGPTTLWGFKTRGVGPTELRRQRGEENDDNGNSLMHDSVGGDLAVTAFADLSFDLPIRWLREQGIHAHIFAGSGNAAKLTQNEYKHFSPRKFFDSFRLSVGCGIVIPNRLFRLECNYFHLLRKDEHDRGKTGFRFSFSAPL